MIALLLAALLTGAPRHDAPLRLVQTIPLPGVQGRIDHMAVDVKGRRLFVAALGNNTLEVIDLAAGKRLKSISALQEPQGVAYLAASDRIVVANGQGTGCDLYDGRTYRKLFEVGLGEDSDNVRYDSAGRRFFVGCGSGRLAEVAESGSADSVRTTRLPGHPESFQLESSGPRIYVNVPATRKVVIVEKRTLSVVAEWPLPSVEQNFPMALDEANKRLFVGCRKPAELVVFDTEKGRMATMVAIGGDTDDLFYDAARKRVYVSCGDGVIDVLQQDTPDRYRSIARIPTRAGARTSLYVPAFNRLYVACRAANGGPAEIRVYEAK